MDITWIVASGVLIGIIIFALKVSLGCGLASLNRKETLVIASGYLVLSLIMGTAIDQIPEETLTSLLNLGVAMHMIIALLLVAVGVITAREWNQHGHDLTRKTFWVLSVPCPACMAATFLSCSVLAGLLEFTPWKVGALVGLIFFVTIAVLSTTMGQVGKTPSTMGNVMIFVGLFYILSMLIIPAYLNAQATIFVPATVPASDLIVSYLIIAALIVSGFVGRRMGVTL